MKVVHCRAYGQITRSEPEGDDLIVYGRASAGNLDRYGTHIDQESLWEAAQKNPPTTLFYNHDHNAGIGTVEGFDRHIDKEMGPSLMARARIGKDFDFPLAVGLGALNYSVNNIRQQVQQGITRGYSIGFDGFKKEDPNGGPPTIFVTDFIELSICPIPANPLTKFGFSRSIILDGDDEKGNGFKQQIITAKALSSGRFEFAPEERKKEEEEELETIMYALANLKQAVAEW